MGKACCVRWIIQLSRVVRSDPASKPVARYPNSSIFLRQGMGWHAEDPISGVQTVKCANKSEMGFDSTLQFRGFLMTRFEVGRKVQTVTLWQRFGSSSLI